MIILTKKAYFKLKHFAQNADMEISGLGKSKMINDQDILVKDITIFPQENSAVSTVLKTESLVKFLNDKMKKGQDISQWNVWWHSHNNFGVFWSSADEDTIETFTGGDYFISIVVNEDLDMIGRIDIFNPFRLVIDTKVVKPRGLSKIGLEDKINQHTIKRIKRCVKKQRDFFVRPRFLTPESTEKQLPWWEEEILDQRSSMD